MNQHDQATLYLLSRIAQRAEDIQRNRRHGGTSAHASFKRYRPAQDWLNDVSLVHARTPLDLQAMLVANDREFFDDMMLIALTLNRQTGELLPASTRLRFAVSQ